MTNDSCAIACSCFTWPNFTWPFSKSPNAGRSHWSSMQIRTLLSTALEWNQYFWGFTATLCSGQYVMLMNQSGSHYVHNTGYNNIYIQIGHKHQISSYKYNMCIRDMCLFNSKKLFIMSMSILFIVPDLHSFSNTFLRASLCVWLFPKHNYMFKVITG